MPVQIAEPSALQVWVNEYGNIVYFFGQLIFWLALAVAAVYAVVLLKRLVDHKIGTAAASAAATGVSAQAGTADVASASKSETIDIDKFVE